MFAITIPDRTALCSSIRSRTRGYGTRDHHHWSICIPGEVQLHGVSCAVCGNYQQVSTYDLQNALMENARHILCEDPEHARLTDSISPEMDSDFATDSIPNLVEDSESETDSMPDLLPPEDDDLGPPPPLPPILIRSEGYDWRLNNLNDWSQDDFYDWGSRDNENLRDLPRQ